MLRSALILFDLDDTLLITDARIILRDPITNEVRYRLPTDVFRDWKKRGQIQDFKLDFAEFSSVEDVVKSFLAAKPGPGLHILRDAIDDEETEIGILTARANEDAIEIALPKFLAKQGIDIEINPNLIFAVHDPKYSFPTTMTDSERKLQIILQLIDDQVFDHIFLIDDDPIHKQVIDSYCEKNKIQNVYVYSV